MRTLSAGHIANVDASERLCVPLDALRAVEWWDAKPVDVVAEIVQPGLVRVYLAAEALPMIAKLKSQLNELPIEARTEHLAAIADRYRALKLYGEGRLRITKEVAQILGFVLGERPSFFVQPLTSCFEILSLEFRAARLAKTIELTSINLHYKGMD